MSVRNQNGAITSIEERTRRKIADVDRLLAEYADVIRKDGYGYSRARSVRERSPQLLGWDQRTSTAVMALRSRGAASAGQRPKSTLMYVYVRREDPGGIVRVVDRKCVTEAIRRFSHEPAAAVRAAERWLWPTSKRQVGQFEQRLDVLIAREAGLPSRANILEQTEHLIGARHRLRAQEIAECDGLIFGLHPTLRAVNGDYPAFCGENEWYSFHLPRQGKAQADTSSER